MQNKYVDDSGWYTRRWKIPFCASLCRSTWITIWGRIGLDPISPSYQEPHDLLGYLHPNGTFIESETKLVRALMKAKRKSKSAVYNRF